MAPAFVGEVVKDEARTLKGAVIPLVLGTNVKARLVEVEEIREAPSGPSADGPKTQSIDTNPKFPRYAPRSIQSAAAVAKASKAR